MQVCARVIGNDTTVTWAAAQLRNFELNVMHARASHTPSSRSLRLLANVVERLPPKSCIVGIKSRKRRTLRRARSNTRWPWSPRLAPIIGYDQSSAEIAKESAKTGKTVRETLPRDGKSSPKIELTKALGPHGHDQARRRRRCGRIERTHFICSRPRKEAG